MVVLKITEPQPQFGRVMVADYLPAGFEIDNPHLVSSGDTGTLPWITDAAQPVDTEFRDDRFTAAFDRKRGDPAMFTVAYVVRAVSPGNYVLPQASVEDMYRPDRFGRTAPDSDRGHGGEMSEALERDRGFRSLPAQAGIPTEKAEPRPLGPPVAGGRALFGKRRPLRVVLIAAALFCICATAASVCVDRFARPAAARQGSGVLDPGGRSRRQAAARLCHRRGPLAAAGASVADVDPRFFDSCSPMKTNAFARITASIRWR